MIRINLLPPEIAAKRRFERIRVYVAIGSLVFIGVLAAVWMYGLTQVAARSSQLQALRTEAEKYRSTAESYKVFESRKEDLVGRKSIADRALADRILWGRLSDEMSLVLPSGMWVTRIGFSEEAGLELEGSAVDAIADVPDAGHKEIAKLLVRLADMPQLYDVWLVNSEKVLIEDQPGINWKVTGRVRTPSEESSASASSASPVQPVSR